MAIEGRTGMDLMDEHTLLVKRKLKMRLVTVEPIIFCFFFTYALLQPLLQQYIYDELSEQYNFTKGDKDKLCVLENGTDAGQNISSLENLVQTQASHWFLVLTLCACLPSVITTLILGSLSDVVGRKPVILLALIGVFLRCLVIAITVTFGFPFYVVFLGSFIEGLTGSLATIQGSTLAYIIDVTDNKSRSFRLGVLQITIMMAVTASFVISGVWVKSSGYEQPFWAGAGLLFICGFYVVLFMPESLKAKPQHQTGFSCMPQLKAIKQFIILKRGPYVKTCLVLLFISYVFSILDYFGGVTIVYTMHSPLCWGSELIGYFLAARTAVAGLGIFVGLKLVGRIFSDCMLVIIGCLSYSLSILVIGFAETTVVMFLSCVPGLFSVLAPPCIRSIASKMVGEHEKGTLSSVLGVVEALTQVIAPILSNLLYPVGLTTLHVNGFVYFFQAAILFIPIVLFSIILYLTRKYQNILYHVLKEVEATVQT